jgi:hypothetical protein
MCSEQYLHEAGFANARLAIEYDHLPFPLLGLLPTPEQPPNFFFSTHQRGEASRNRHLQAATRATRHMTR